MDGLYRLGVNYYVHSLLFPYKGFVYEVNSIFISLCGICSPRILIAQINAVLCCDLIREHFILLKQSGTKNIQKKWTLQVTICVTYYYI